VVKLYLSFQRGRSGGLNFPLRTVSLESKIPPKDFIMMLIETRVQPSTIHGLGLFAVKFISRGTPVWRFQPGFDHDFSPAQFAALPPLARQHARWFCFVSKTSGHVILSGDHACFINHSLNPNTGAPPSAASPVVTAALRDIAAGEEITCNYFDYDADTPWKLGLVPADAPLGAAATAKL
jgi:SET domain-containing protein